MKISTAYRSTRKRGSWLDFSQNPTFLILLAILASLAFFYLQRSLILRQEACSPLRSAHGNPSSSKFKLTISIITFNRLQPLKRLIRSLLNAHYDEDASVSISFHVEAGAPQELQAFVDELHWPFGIKQIHSRVINSGLVPAVVESWYPSDPDDYGLLLEDDIEVSPYYYMWIQHALSEMQSSNMLHRMYGVSLYTPRVIETVKPYLHFYPDMELSDMDEKYAYLQHTPCSWGAVYMPKTWTLFSQYMYHRLSTNDSFVIVPDSRTNTWKQSWKKFYIEMAWTNGLFMLYPNFFNQTSFSTNHLEPGVHITHKDTSHLPIDYVVPLHYDSEVMNIMNANRAATFASLPMVDVFGRRYNTEHEKLTDAPTSAAEFEAFSSSSLMRTYFRSNGRVKPRTDQFALMCKQESRDVFSFFSHPETFTVILSTMSNERAHFLRKTVHFLAQQPEISCILIVWHQPFHPHPPSSFINGKMVRYLPTVTDSLNNRFYPSEHITTEAVLVMDDDIFIHGENLRLLFKTWKLFKDKMVGFFPRWYADDHGRRVYIRRHEDKAIPGYPIMLSKAVMLHKEYLYEYSCGLGRAFHAKVDEVASCEDLAMNFLVASMVNGPSSIYVKPLRNVGDYGRSLPGTLFKRTAHENVRSECLQYFETLVGFPLPFQTKSAYGKVDALGLHVLLNRTYEGVGRHQSYCGLGTDVDGCDL